MKILSFITALTLLGCSSIKRFSQLKCTQYYGDMSLLFQKGFLKYKDNSNLKKITRIDVSTIKFEGAIELGDFEVFQEAYNEGKGFNRLIVNSSGGDVEESLKIANLLKKKKLDEIIIHGYCLSSCANYFFPSANNKLIRWGVVGFHGNITALYNQSEEKLKKSLSESEQFMNMIKEEKKFIKNLGLKQSFFEKTQNPDKGTGTGITYAFAVPSILVMKKLGFKNIKGKQNTCIPLGEKIPIVFFN